MGREDDGEAERRRKEREKRRGKSQGAEEMIGGGVDQ